MARLRGARDHAARANFAGSYPGSVYVIHDPDGLYRGWIERSTFAGSLMAGYFAEGMKVSLGLYLGGRAYTEPNDYEVVSIGTTRTRRGKPRADYLPECVLVNDSHVLAVSNTWPPALRAVSEIGGFACVDALPRG